MIVFQTTVSDFAPADLTIFAPNGSLSTSTEPPTNLDAFQTYGRYNGDAGSFDFSLNYPQLGNGPFYFGDTSGTLGGSSVPEPSTLLLLSIAMPVALVIGVRRARGVRYGQPASNDVEPIDRRH